MRANCPKKDPRVYFLFFLNNTITMLSRSIVRSANCMTRNVAGQMPRAGLAATRMNMNVNLNMNKASVRGYHDNVLDHYQNPRNVGTFDKSKKDIGTGLVGAPACGDVMRLQIDVDEESGVIKDVKFKTFGCGSAIASSSYVTELIKGKSLDEALKIQNTAIAKELNLPPVKLHCSMLAEDAIKSAVKDYKGKRMTQPTVGPEAASASASA